MYSYLFGSQTEHERLVADMRRSNSRWGLRIWSGQCRWTVEVDQSDGPVRLTKGQAGLQEYEAQAGMYNL